MAGRLGDLAARMKMAVDAREREEEARAERERLAELERQRAAEEEERRRLSAEQSRDELLDELVGFGEALGAVAVKRGKKTRVLTYEYRGRTLTFTPAEGANVTVGGSVEATLARDDAGEWEVAIPEGEGSRRLPLELGLEELLVVGLELPRSKPTPVDVATAYTPTEVAVELPVAEKPAKKSRKVEEQVLTVEVRNERPASGGGKRARREELPVGGMIREFKGLLD